MEHEGSLSELEALIGYTFQDIKHLETAITHKSFVNEKMVGRYMSYERYEFLGDAILEFIVSKYLFENYQTMPEGDLSKLRLNRKRGSESVLRATYRYRSQIAYVRKFCKDF